MVTRDQLNELLWWDDERQCWIWCERPLASPGAASCNARFAGKVAGSIPPNRDTYVRVGKSFYNSRDLLTLRDTGQLSQHAIDRMAAPTMGAKLRLRRCWGRSGVIGVRTHKNGYRVALIEVGKLINHGVYKTLDEAAVVTGINRKRIAAERSK